MLVKIWFGLVSIILFVSLVSLLVIFSLLNPLHWIWLVILITTAALTLIIYLEQPYKKDAKNLQKTYSDFLKQKDMRIEELQKKSDLLFRTSLKKAEADVELAELKRKLVEKMENKD